MSLRAGQRHSFLRRRKRLHAARQVKRAELIRLVVDYLLKLLAHRQSFLVGRVQGNNLLTFTKYLGSDPEMAMTSSVIGQGIDLGRIGQSRSIVAGVKINL